MQQEFTLNETEDNKRLIFLFPTTDGVTGKTSGVENVLGCAISINNEDFVSTQNAPQIFGGPNTPYPVYWVQLEASEVSTLGQGVVVHKTDTESVWFAGIYRVSVEGGSVANEEVLEYVQNNARMLKLILHLLTASDAIVKDISFRSPL